MRATGRSLTATGAVPATRTLTVPLTGPVSRPLAVSGAVSRPLAVSGPVSRTLSLSLTLSGAGRAPRVARLPRPVRSPFRRRCERIVVLLLPPAIVAGATLPGAAPTRSAAPSGTALARTLPGTALARAVGAAPRCPGGR